MKNLDGKWASVWPYLPLGLAVALLQGTAAGEIAAVLGAFAPPPWWRVGAAVLALACLLLHAFLQARFGRKAQARQLEQFLAELRKWDLEPPPKQDGNPPKNDELTRSDLATLVRAYGSKMYEIEYLKQKAEYDALQSQINPHFLYNTLDTIRGKAVDIRATDVSEMIECLSRIFRYSISYKAFVFTLDDELKNVRDYLQIQKSRFVDRFMVDYQIDTTDAELMYYHMPKLILQPLVENAILHGLEEKLCDGLVTIRAYRTAKYIYIQIEDNGKGMSAEKVRTLNAELRQQQPAEKAAPGAMGIALVNVNKRLNFYYGSGYGLTIYGAEGSGTMVEMCLPYPGPANED